MYLAKDFKEEDLDKIKNLVRENPFATMITTVEQQPFVTHLPLILDDSAEQLKIIGHMARANPHWKNFNLEQNVLVIFHGPHTYITPNWYTGTLNVPTWNYAVVHISGKVRMVEDYQDVYSILAKSVTEFEKGSASPWKFDLPEKFTKDLTKAIVAFEIEVTGLESKFKMSQNQSAENRNGVIAGLKTRTDEMSQKVLQLMLDR